MDSNGVVGVRALKQNAAAVVRRARGGETVTITDRGTPVAQLTPVPASTIARLLASGTLRPPVAAALPQPVPGAPATDDLRAMRDDERY